MGLWPIGQWPDVRVLGLRPSTLTTGDDGLGLRPSPSSPGTARGEGPSKSPAQWAFGPLALKTAARPNGPSAHWPFFEGPATTEKHLCQPFGLTRLLFSSGLIGKRQSRPLAILGLRPSGQWPLCLTEHPAIGPSAQWPYTRALRTGIWAFGPYASCVGARGRAGQYKSCSFNTESNLVKWAFGPLHEAALLTFEYGIWAFGPYAS